MDRDRKFAITVAAVIGVGVASIVGLSLVGRDGEQSSRSVAPAKLSGASAPVAVPASVPAPTLAPTPWPEPISAGTPEEAEQFVVEAGVNYLTRGIEAYQARNFEHATAYLFADVDASPERAYSHYLLGLSLWKSGRLDEAVEPMARSAELDGTAVKTFVNLSRIQNDRGDFDAALEASGRALDLEPQNAAALFLEGRSLRNLGEIEPALESLNRSLEVDRSNGHVWNLLGLTLLGEGDDLATLEAFRTAASLQPEVAYIHNNLGMALELNSQPAEAVLAYRRAVELDAGHERAARNLARVEPTAPGLAHDEDDEIGVAELIDAEPADGGSN